MSDDLIPVRTVGKILGISASSVRLWEAAGRLPPAVRLPGRGDRRFSRRAVEQIARNQDIDHTVRVAAYVRVSSSTDQASSLATQEAEIRDELGEHETVTLVARDRASGLNDKRRGLQRVLDAARAHTIDVVVVTHADRLTRFGYGHVEALLNAYGCAVRVLHERVDADPHQELMDDFMSLVATFSDRLYGQRSAAARTRLLQESARD